MRITSHVLSATGSRSYNQDAHGDQELPAGRCLVVADGAGGHLGGDRAARLVIDAVMLHLAAAPSWNPEVLVAAVDAASASVRRAQLVEERLKQMSSTVVVLCIDAAGSVAHWSHLGDSRILLFRRGAAHQLTRDHSVLQSLTDAGLLSESSSAHGVDRTMLYAAIGAEGDTRPVAGAGMKLEDGDVFLLCTDGVWDSVGAAQMGALLAFCASVDEWVESIGNEVRAAAKHNQDNYTALGVWVGDPDQITVTKV